MSIGAKAFFLGFLMVFFFGPDMALGASPSPDGGQIFRQQCAKCHGRSGGGVKGKYDDALQGEWAVERLARYIGKKMPEDDPGTCRGANAEAVARYIYDSFYSQKARWRGHMPRVELLHLTNRQFVNSVADLIKTFTGGDGKWGTNRGLQAAYFNSRNFDNEKKVYDRIDQQIGINFTGTNWDPNLNGTNGFAVRWRGALVAEETGDYEFTLKTTNGARLWINDDEDPIIDSWVGGGTLAEHHVVLRLIGGRAYPFKLQYFRYKEKTALLSLRWKPPHGVEEPIPSRVMAPDNISATFVLTTPFPADDSSMGYERGMGVSKAWEEAVTRAAIETAGYIVKNLDRLAHSQPEDTNRLDKVRTFCERFVATAYRRPLTDEQKKAFVAGPFEGAKKLEDAVKRVVILAMLSPRFLYTEPDSGKADDYDVAARLSFDLWDSIPDHALEQAAAQGKLRTEDQVVRQARRMLNDPRAHAKMLYFLQLWLQMNVRDDLSKDSTLFPGFTPEIIADLRVSLNLFLEDAVWSGSSDYRALLLADYLFLNDRLAQFYGVKSPGGAGFAKAEFDPAQRCGVLTHPLLLAEFSYQRSTSPIHRGVFLTRNIVGRALRPPPMAQVFKDADFAPNLTMREKVSQMTRPQACQGCHSVINPLGFSLEHYDAVGRFREGERDRPIDSAGDYLTDDGETVHLTGPRDLAEFAAGSEQAQNAFIAHLFNQIVEQPMLAYGIDTKDQLRETFVASQFNMRELLVRVATLSALHNVEIATGADAPNQGKPKNDAHSVAKPPA